MPQTYVDTHDNRRRSQSVAKAVKAMGTGDHGDNLTDMLTNLRHWAARRGVSFAKALRISRGHFTLEATGHKD